MHKALVESFAIVGASVLQGRLVNFGGPVPNISQLNHKTDFSGLRIKKKYLKGDSSGLPYIITVEAELSATIRERDSKEQIRIRVLDTKENKEILLTKKRQRSDQEFVDGSSATFSQDNSATFSQDSSATFSQDSSATFTQT
ncbi:glycine--tRNA ligase, mitochondrial 1-like protein [Tanacetum coccineum]